MFQIAAFARLGGVSPKVLRDYDSLGLFRPAWVDRQSGYRLYSAAQLPELRRIVGLRDLGLGLGEIRALVHEGADLRAVLEAKRRSLEEARRELDRRLASLGISMAADSGVGPDVVLRDIPSELVATMDVGRVGGDVGRAFYELESLIRDAGVRASRPPGALMTDEAGSGRPAVEVFAPVRRAAATLDVRRLPAIRAATILNHGSYATMAATRRALDDWVVASGLRGSQPTRILYLQFGAEEDLHLPRQYLVQRAEDLVTEIQRPIVDRSQNQPGSCSASAA